MNGAPDVFGHRQRLPPGRVGSILPRLLRNRQRPGHSWQLECNQSVALPSDRNALPPTGASLSAAAPVTETAVRTWRFVRGIPSCLPQKGVIRMRASASESCLLIHGTGVQFVAVLDPDPFFF